jgi:1-acyl-sn-glycerol-3-phosphate acyltransferase
MTDADLPDSDSGATVELALSDIRGGPPTSRADLRAELSGLEPERRVTDWGRSERLEGAVDRTVYEFLYRYWFRTGVEGIENVPRDAGALLLANRGGASPADAAMIVKAIREEHPHPRPVHVITDRALQGVPGLGMVARKIGAVPAHPANLQRLLFDERQLVLAFPEGAAGARKVLRERYRLRDFGRGGLVAAAISARAPIVPVAVLGAEEATPLFARINLLGRVTRLPCLPLTTAIPLPAKFTIRFLEPVAPDELAAARTERAVRALAQDIRALLQENLLEMAAQRRSVWLG